MEHTLNKSLFIILPNLTCFFWEKNRHFILVYLVSRDVSTRREFSFKIYSENIVVMVQNNILKIFTILYHTLKLIKFILYFIVVLLINERDLH